MKIKKIWNETRSRRSYAIAILLAVAALALLTRQGIFSPGPLNAVASGNKLGGISAHSDLSGRCGSCHAPPLSSTDPAARCLSCHSNSMGGKHHLGGPHRPVLEAQRSCAGGCHTEHRGPTAPLTRTSAATRIPLGGSGSIF